MSGLLEGFRKKLRYQKKSESNRNFHKRKKLR
jgi:hypothetical protein